MKKTRWMLVLAAALLVVLPAAGYDDEEYTPPEDDSEGNVDLGYQDSDTDGNLQRVAEFNDVDANVVGGLNWKNSPYKKNQYDFMIDWTSRDQFKTELDFDWNRVVRVNVDAVALPHKLEHDPLTSLQAVSTIKVVRSTDLEPGRNYQIRYENAAVDGDFLVPSVTGLSFHAGLRVQNREGTKQSLHTGHCTSCHTVAQGREVDQTTQDATLGIHFSRGVIDLDYRVMSRSAEENGATPVATFETPFRPAPPPWAPNQDALPGETLFIDRLWFPGPTGAPYDSATAIYDLVPKTEKIAHTLKFKAAIRKVDALNFTFVQSTTKNDTTSLEYDVQGFRGRYTWVPRKKLRVNFIAKRTKIDNQSVFLDLSALWGGGPWETTYGGVGQTTFEGWREWLDANGGTDVRADPMNFTTGTRLSSMNRTNDRLGFDLFWRPMKRGTFRGGLFYRSVDRENVVLLDGTGKTESVKLKLGWNMRFGKRVRWFNALVYENIDNPYMNVAGARRAFQGFREDGFVFGLGDTDLATPPGPTPKNPYSLQYYQLQSYRVANLSNAPSGVARFRSAVNWSPKGNWTLGGNFKYNTSENDELNYSTYERESLGVGASFWMAAAPTVHFTLAADVFSGDTDAYVAIPLMDG
jgi:hypothetical protein